jgi:hypothetical protein
VDATGEDDPEGDREPADRLDVELPAAPEQLGRLREIRELVPPRDRARYDREMSVSLLLGTVVVLAMALLAVAVTYVSTRPITKRSSERHQLPVTEEQR